MHNNKPVFQASQGKLKKMKKHQLVLAICANFLENHENL